MIEMKKNHPGVPGLVLFSQAKIGNIYQLIGSIGWFTIVGMSEIDGFRGI